MKLLHLGVAALTVSAVAVVGLASTTSCTDQSSLRQAFMALDGNGDRVRDQFFTDTQVIYCDAVFSGHGSGQTVQAVITQTKGELPQDFGTGKLSTLGGIIWAAGEEAPGPGISTVSFSWIIQSDAGSTAPFAVGHYNCALSVNGDSPTVTEFDIDYPSPDCPAAGGAEPGALCAGFYMTNPAASCPNAENLAGGPCTCDGPSGTWNCP